jgi:outer membrane translocation and assembly module TamA
MEKSERHEPVYISGLNTGVYSHKQTNALFFGGWSAGLIDGWTRRHTLGFSYQDNTYQSIPDQSPAGALPSDLTLAYPYYRFEVIQDRFRTQINMDQIGKPEDFTLGLVAVAQLGRSLTALGSTREQWIYTASLAKGYEVMSKGILLASAGQSGRYSAGRGEQEQSTAAARYFYRHDNGFTFFGAISGDVVRNPDVPNPLLLGGDNGLRGYPLRYQSGEKRVLLNLEERVYSDWYPFRLIRVGGAAFYDVGRAWAGTNPNSANPGWLHDVGIGLRFLADRSAVSNVLHVDFAFPLRREPGIKSYQFLVHTKVTL